jgi:hypothetical protein
MLENGAESMLCEDLRRGFFSRPLHRRGPLTPTCMIMILILINSFFSFIQIVQMEFCPNFAELFPFQLRKCTQVSIPLRMRDESRVIGLDL